MPIDFCPGYTTTPFKTLARNYPGPDVYPTTDFRTEWGPIFHRGRLNGTARVLVIGQDPAQSEAVVRRILVGNAGKRVQGFLHKLGIRKRYVILNTYVYSVFGQQGGNAHINDPGITAYRNLWIAGVLDKSPIDAVVAFGGLARQAWEAWLDSPAAIGRAALHVEHLPHPTSPTAGGASEAQAAAATATMLAKYNAAIQRIGPILGATDAASSPLYGNAFTDDDLPDIPMADLPPGTPAWMSTEEEWAKRVGDTAAIKRRTIQITVPPSVPL
jgi:uracil-DNA glycosylase